VGLVQDARTAGTVGWTRGVVYMRALTEVHLYVGRVDLRLYETKNGTGYQSEN
jgi:hypothetical protein